MHQLLTRFPRPLLVLLVFAGLLRAGVVIWKFDSLSADPDKYGVIAGNLLDGQGFCTEMDRPTAFRPPLYPFLIAACGLLGGTALVAAIHVLLGTATVGMTWGVAQRLGLSSRVCLAAAGLVAVDPLLLLYSTHLMTETLFTFLVTGLLLSLHGEESKRHSVIGGCWFGFAALCRPTIWAFAFLSGACVATVTLKRRLAGQTGSADHRRHLSCVFALTAVLVVSPWVLRNLFVFGQPTFMTTHGGYTLLLGNNPVFYNEVVAGGGQSVWSGDSLRDWQLSLEEQLQTNPLSLSEHERSHRLHNMAVDWIRKNPGSFLECVWLRVRRLWSPGPENSQGIPETILVTVRRYYQVTYLLVLAGLIRHRNKWRNVWVLLAFLASLTLLHSVYWANARMRAPAIPIVSILAVAVFSTMNPTRFRRDLPHSEWSSSPPDEKGVNH